MKRHLLLYLFCFGIFLTSPARANEFAETAEALAQKGKEIATSNSALVSSTDKIATELANGGVSKAAVESLAGSAGDIAKQAGEIGASATKLANKAIDGAMAAGTQAVNQAVNSATEYVVKGVSGLVPDTKILEGAAGTLAKEATNFVNGANIDPKALLGSAGNVSGLVGGVTDKITSLTSSPAVSALSSGGILNSGGSSSGTGTADGVTAIGPVIASNPTGAQSGYSCTPGLPCIQPKTPNDPLNPADGANMGGNNALKSGSAGCDADFMNQVYARAWLESDREMKAASVAIRKPDSVLEYSCFDQIVSMVAHKIGPIFSESTDFQNRPFAHSTMGMGAYTTYMGNDSLDKALEGTVLASIKNYQTNNFAHKSLGGTGSADGAFTGKIGGDKYNCDMMNRVHFLAQCANFGTDNQFLTFENMTTLDPRVFPAECGKTVSQATVDLATNNGFLFANFDIFTDYKTLLDPGVCGTPIPTGVSVTAYEVGRDFETGPPVTGQTYADQICSNPGCYFDGSACKF